MVKAGIIVGIAALFLAVGIALLSPLCVPCMALLLGLGAGFLGGVFEKPIAGTETTKTGALAGLISGIGMALGQAIGAVINSVMVGPEGTARMLETLGLQSGGATTLGPGYWVVLISSTICFGIVDIALMAGFGVLGAILYGKFFRNRP